MLNDDDFIDNMIKKEFNHRFTLLDQNRKNTVNMIMKHLNNSYFKSKIKKEIKQKIKDEYENEFFKFKKLIIEDVKKQMIEKVILEELDNMRLDIIKMKD